MAEKGLISGYTDGTFRGQNNVTYSEAMQMLYNVMSKTGNLKSVAPNTQVMYQPLLTSYKVPMWAQYSTSYGLAAKLLTVSRCCKIYNKQSG